MLRVSLNWGGLGRLQGFAVLLALVLTPEMYAQSPTVGSTEDATPETISAVPIFSVGAGFITEFDGGTPHLEPLVAPIFLVPIGQKWLIETRGTFESDLIPDPTGPGWKGSLEESLDYLQLDYIANRYLTVSAGRYLTPFGIYDERLYPIWIRDLQTDPLILPIATGPSGAGTGGMLRGGFNVTPKVEINYATYFSTRSTVKHLDSNREIGVRSGIYLPGPRVEVGGSFQHLLQDDHSNAFGFHFAWQPTPLPLDIRAEYARSHNGSGYWIESAYRLSQVPVWRNELRHIQVVGRMQQFYTGKFENENLPSVNTNMFEFGLNYYFRDDIRFVSSCGRQFATDGGNANVWTVGVTYRLAMPLGHGDIQ